jgi:hypothetical protein
LEDSPNNRRIILVGKRIAVDLAIGVVADHLACGMGASRNASIIGDTHDH